MAVFDYSKLKGRIREKVEKQENLAIALGISDTTLSFKLNNKAYFTQDEIRKTVEVLSIPISDIPNYFFKIKV